MGGVDVRERGFPPVADAGGGTAERGCPVKEWRAVGLDEEEGAPGAGPDEAEPFGRSQHVPAAVSAVEIDAFVRRAFYVEGMGGSPSGAVHVGGPLQRRVVVDTGQDVVLHPGLSALAALGGRRRERQRDGDGGALAGQGRDLPRREKPPFSKPQACGDRKQATGGVPAGLAAPKCVVGFAVRVVARESVDQQLGVRLLQVLAGGVPSGSPYGGEVTGGLHSYAVGAQVESFGVGERDLVAVTLVYSPLIKRRDCLDRKIPARRPEPDLQRAG